ncbi:uncharacterized protein EV420DRAFT_1500752 [Desarmillaria tabescens]|uniref:Uncharacterized protein n=1 Tax=Armillaria tabescens TaxID=1929756 RepID=A0AA39NRD2_ARMTA|nr:uncharacterized protein EV420DRAFT_1500752 [Desarmillaria tabescens]KAK0470447.1 hypothetical protein EV420DRAFT_1500752 [Desarmillaria tabescens]
MASRTGKTRSDISVMKTSDDGTFKCAPLSFRNVIEKVYIEQHRADRYHSYACPWQPEP